MMEKDLNTSGPGRLVSGGFWFLGLMLLSGVFWLLLGIQVTRSLGPSGFGLFNMTYSIFDFMWALCFGGLFEGLIHFGACQLAQKNSNIPVYFSNYVRYLTGLSLVIFVIMTALSFIATDIIIRIVILSLAFGFLVSGTKDSLSSIIGSLHNSKQLSIIQSSGFYAVSILGIALLVFGLPFELLPVLVVVAPICQLIVCLYFLKPYLKDLLLLNVYYFISKKIKEELKEDWKQFKHILIFGLSISVGKISFMIMKSLDIPILNLFFDFSNVGIYSVADTVSSVLFSMTAFSLPIISNISEAWSQKDENLIEKYVKISVKYPLLLGLPLTIVIFGLADSIVVGIYGIEFQGAVMPLQILIVGTFLLMFAQTLSSILIGIGKPKLSGLLLATAAIQYLISLFFFVPIFGLNGAAVSLTLTGVTSLVLIPTFIKRHLKVDVFTGVHKLILGGAILSLIIYVIPKFNFFIVIIGAAASIAFYFIMLYYIGYISKEDISMIKARTKT
jgi:stage V sporulation protein B